MDSELSGYVLRFILTVNSGIYWSCMLQSNYIDKGGCYSKGRSG